jgi:DNA phosphorothioation-associated DGQHR protein 1
MLLAAPAPTASELYAAKLKAIRRELRDEYLAPHDHPWIIGFSGGKDSTLLLHFVLEAIRTIAPDERRRPVYIVSNNTLVESPVFQEFVDRLLARLEDSLAGLNVPLRVVRTHPVPEESFWVNLLGKGYPAPNRTFRWCNSVILAANYREEDGLVEDDETSKWRFDIAPEGLSGQLTIPKPAKLAPVIDGQHRLFGFNYATKTERLDMPLLCAIFFDLPKPYQAYLFATINANQRPVNKSQTYELFGYNVEDEPPERWTPEKLAVFLARKLNTESESPFREHIVVAAENDFAPSIAEIRRSGNWAVSTATVVEGIVRLISSNPKKDAYAMDGKLEYRVQDRTVLEPARDPRQTPLRALYCSKNDDLIYTGVKNYFGAVERLFWRQATPDSYIRKTVGVQALFDVAKPIMAERVEQKDFRQMEFENRLKPAAHIDFADGNFEASGRGPQWIRTSIELCIGLRSLDSVKEEDRETFQRICRLD